jgi:TolB-like protein/Flp pilus assembly protein TadD
MACVERLDSWKAIAKYLGRDVSTVRRWEKTEGLPVHRHLHQKQGSVYAFPAELDDWWKNGTRADDRAQDERPNRRLLIPSLVTFTVVIAGLLYGLAGVRHAAISVDAIDSIAVMPFAYPDGNTADDDMFVETLSEGISRGLAEMRGLKVISPMSTVRYKGKQIVPSRVGRELGGVEALLVGRIRRLADRVSLSVELVDARDERQVWGRTYKSGELSSTESFHQIVVGDVVQALKGRAQTTSYSRYARNAEVYQLWLRGRHHWYKRTPDGYERAIKAFSQAIERDPTFAPAYAGLADTYTVMSYFSQLIPFEEARSKARAAAVKALALDDTLAEAHTSMASVLEFEQWDWAGAEREYQRAIQLAPSYATAYHWYANNLSVRGRHQEAITYASRAVEIDPLSPILQVALAHAYVLAGQDEEALVALSKALEIEPASGNAHLFRGMIYSRQARYDEALGEMLIANRQFENWVWKAFLADLYVRMDRRDEAQRIVQAFETRRPGVSRVTAAALYAAVGERQRPLALLRGACDARDPDITFLQSVPAFDRLRGDPEFQALLRRSGLI